MAESRDKAINEVRELNKQNEQLKKEIADNLRIKEISVKKEELNEVENNLNEQLNTMKEKLEFDCKMYLGTSEKCNLQKSPFLSHALMYFLSRVKTKKWNLCWSKKENWKRLRLKETERKGDSEIDKSIKRKAVRVSKIDSAKRR